MSKTCVRDRIASNLVAFGPHANCTLELCDIDQSVYKYLPSIPINAAFAGLFGLAMFIHIVLGFRWRTWGFMNFMILGCLIEISGYFGRIILHHNPFQFEAFLLQIVFLTAGPVFYTAAIYVTLSRTILFLDPALSRLKPQMFYWVFIPADLLCLVLQAAGGALSTIDTSSSSTGVDVSMVGLGLQVFSLLVFFALFGDYLTRYCRKHSVSGLAPKMRVFLIFLGSASLLIFVRSVYRCYELSQGYVNSKLITDQALFIWLEGVLMALAVFSLCAANPGMVFPPEVAKGQRPLRNSYNSTDEFNEAKPFLMRPRNDGEHNTAIAMA